MKINSIILENFRGAQSVKIDLNPGLNVLVGKNGSGKSSVLDAIALSLSWVAARIRHKGSPGRPIMEHDIRVGAKGARISLHAQAHTEDYRWSLAKTRAGRDSAMGRSELYEASELAATYRAKITENEGYCAIPLLAYYPVNRSVLDIPLRIRSRHSFDLMSAYEESLTSGANFRVFFEWFREREDIENEALRDRGLRSADVQLEAVRRALKKFMPNYKNIRVMRNPLRMTVRKNDIELTVNQLSDGEKCLMALVGDLARRMAIANPDASNPLKGKGVVLVDEVDLHLHPKWQRLVVDRLQDTFPNVQFIVSTHSPHILTHVRPEQVYMVNFGEGEVEVSNPQSSFGMTAEAILEDLMGLETTRPDDIQERISHMFAAISQKNYKLAEGARKRLLSQIGADPELVKAGILIKSGRSKNEKNQ